MTDLVGEDLTARLRAAHKAGDTPRVVWFARILNERYERQRRERTEALKAAGFWR